MPDVAAARARRRRALVLAGVIAAACVAVLSVPWCPRRTLQAPRVVGSGVSAAPLLAGAAHVPIGVKFPVEVAGYGIPRPEVRSAAVPLEARAVVLAAGALKLGVVSTDVIFIPESRAAEVREAGRRAGLSDVFVAATHAHTSLGQYAPRLLEEVGATNRYRADEHDALRAGLISALEQASGRLEPVELRAAEKKVALSTSRKGLPGTDDRLTRVSLTGAHGAVAELVVLAAHATLAPHPSAVLDPDFPARFAERELAAGRGVALFLQGAEGNAAPRARAVEGRSRMDTFAEDVSRAVASLEPQPVSPRLGYARVALSLPRPDASRLVPPWARGAGANLLCVGGPAEATLSMLELGPVRWLLVPGEPTYESSRVLEAESGATRTLGLVDGYIGYIEPEARVRARQGESSMQYFGPELLDELARAAKVAAGTMRGAR